MRLGDRRELRAQLGRTVHRHLRRLQLQRKRMLLEDLRIRHIRTQIDTPWTNGKVGMWGKSYDAWTQVMALSQNPPHLEAVVIQAPLIEGYGIGYVNGVHHSATWYATTSLYMLYDYQPPAIDQAGRQRTALAAANRPRRQGRRSPRAGLPTPARRPSRGRAAALR